MDILEELQSSHSAILEFYDLSEADLNRTYAPGKGTIKQILVHLSDAESVMLYRIKRVISEPRQVIWAFEQDYVCRL